MIPLLGGFVVPVAVRAQSVSEGAAAATPNTPQSISDAPEPNPAGIPDVGQLFPPAKDAQGVSASLKILVMLTVLSLAPSILIMMTSFTRIMVVLALLRQALGTQQLPPGQVLTGLSLIMTMLVMAPTWAKMKTAAVDPYLNGTMGQADAFTQGVAPLREFMFRQIEAADNQEHVYLFVEYARDEPIPADVQLKHQDVNLSELIPAFVLSELKTAFAMGFRIYLPFLVIDMVIASILISMGMMMLPPVLISLPFKLMLFVLADGWGLVVGSLLNSFQ
ncbi:MAG TPA: flagellar type III secretion system pore protein FliP [Phycisphaerae bacterium]|nr:flagellar type III secretion system pore protein FliP [Phycisphaerae bacterium]